MIKYTVPAYLVQWLSHIHVLSLRLHIEHPHARHAARHPRQHPPHPPPISRVHQLVCVHMQQPLQAVLCSPGQATRHCILLSQHQAGVAAQWPRQLLLDALKVRSGVVGESWVGQGWVQRVCGDCSQA